MNLDVIQKPPAPYMSNKAGGKEDGDADYNISFPFSLESHLQSGQLIFVEYSNPLSRPDIHKSFILIEAG